MKPISTIIAVLALLFLAVRPAHAEEVIRSFISDVTVETDGRLEVRETIVVRSESREIRRGILRDFPITYNNKNGTRTRVGFDVLRVQRNGNDEPYSTESIANGLRIRIGSKDVLLNPGEHTYKITYQTNRQIGFFDSYDELYWNVTGNGWTFPIEQATVIVRLPGGAEIIQERSSLYVGPQGDNSGVGELVQNSGDRFNARTTGRLQAYEGFTIAVAWQKGIVLPPTATDIQRDWVKDNLGFFSLVLTALGVGFFYIWAWFKVGRDPAAGVIAPLFHPPEGLGAAGVRYVWKQGYDDKAFAAGLVGLAVKGRMKIDGTGSDYAVTKQQSVNRQALTRSEAALFAATPGGTLQLEQSNHATVGGMRSALSQALNDEYDGSMFLNNFSWFATGLGLSIVGLLLSVFLMPMGEGIVVLFTGLFTSVWWGVILLAGWAAIKGLFSGIGFLTKVRSLMGMIFLLPFVGAGIAVPTVLYMVEDISPAMRWLIAAGIVIGVFNLVFYFLLKAPTLSGRKVMDQIEGFRMYMTTAEEERLKVLHPPEKTPELFERYLPFAMALDCENDWNNKFSAVLAAAAAAGAAGGVGYWYLGNDGFGSSSFGTSLSDSLTSSISSAATAPGDSSGSSGGGFSGGGGGGGGGSGW